MPDFVLVQPPNPVLLDPTTRWPLGLAYLEAMLVQEGAQVAVVDLRDKTVELSLIPDAPYIGIAATTGEIGYAKELARLVKSRNSNTTTIIGGAHATYLPQDCTKDFDLVALGEFDQAIVTLLEKGHPGHRVYGGPVPDLDALPFPSRHPFSFSDTLFQGAGYGKGPLATSIITSRGCPWTCSFCQAEPRPVRFRSPENVVAELQAIQQKWNCNHFRFEDDNLTMNNGRALELFRLMKPLGVRWRAHTRSSLWNDDLAQAAKAAGCVEMGFGVESADQRVLDLINKRETVGAHIRAIRQAEEVGVQAKAFIMTGLPGEGDNIVELTRAFLCQAQPSKVILSRFTPYPGSDVWARPAHYNVAWLDPDLSHYWNFPHHTTVTYFGAPKEMLDQRYTALYELIWQGDRRDSGRR